MNVRIVKLLSTAFTCLITGILLISAASADTAVPTLQNEFDRAMATGDFKGAVKIGLAMRSRAQSEGRKNDEITIMLGIARAYQSIGYNREAMNLLKEAQELTAKDTDSVLSASVAGWLANAHMLAGDYDIAGELLGSALSAARKGGNAGVVASILNFQGNLLMLRKQYGPALEAYKEGITQGNQAGSRDLVPRINANAARAALSLGDVALAEKYLATAREFFMKLPDSHDKAFGLINVGKTYGDLAELIPAQKDAFGQKAESAYQDALRTAQAVYDHGSAAYAFGYLGQFYEKAGKDEKALEFTYYADAEAKAASAPESLYLWQWQAGRIFARRGQHGEALNAFRSSVATLQTIRTEFEGDCKLYNQLATSNTLEAVYLGLVDLLLKHEETVADPGEKSRLLAEAVQGIEQMKTNELRSYFQNTCILEQRVSFDRRDNIPQKTTIVYLIPLPDRLEMVASLPVGLKKIRVDVSRDDLTRVVRDFRFNLEKRTSREYLTSSQQLYRWMVTPLEKELAAAGIDTLVFVLEGALRTIPFAALHDGNDFLISKFAVASIPSLSLTDLTMAQRERPSILLAGISEGIQGFSPLNYVPVELKGIQALFGGQVFLNNEFTEASLRTTLEQQPYSIVHIATHGEFSENVSETYILSWDGRITMDQLEKTIKISRYRKKPIDLLTLSACQSAASNDRAALGLAGLSVKAGARSAVATLWYVDDESSSGIMSEFYTQLKSPSVSKASALRQAQVKLISEGRYRHPAYWSPFLMIGNWN